MRKSHRSSSRRRMVSQGLALTLALGLLLWVKLRLVTNVTRTAYAEPDKKHVQPAKPKPQVQPPAPAANEHAELAD